MTVDDGDPGAMVITLPSGTVVTIHADGKVDVDGVLDDDAIAIIHSLDPDAEIVCRPRGDGTA